MSGRTTLTEPAGKPESSAYATTTHDNEHSSHQPSFSATSSLSASVDKPAMSSDASTNEDTPAPSFVTIFSLLTIQQFIIFVIPAMLLSMISGGLAPFMTFVIGQAFEAFAKFAVAPISEDSKAALLSAMGLSALELIGLAAGSFILSFLTSRTWIQVGETVTLSLRSIVYKSMSEKHMSWFDTRLASSEEEDASGSAGLMTQFAKDSDEVRAAASLASGFIIQHVTTVIACLVLAFMRSAVLSLVILATLPLLVLIQGLSQGFAGSFLARERSELGRASSIVDRSVTGISAVKGFNAADQEAGVFSQIMASWRRTIIGLGGLWGLTSGLSQFASMAMFVQAFWFGGKMVSDGKIRAGDVMAIFWACLIAMSNLQIMMPQIMVMTKGKFAFAALSSLFSGPAPENTRFPAELLGSIDPGYELPRELNLEGVNFAYPSRPSVPVLSDVTLYIPAYDTTFIVGDSGSGKSTVALLLLSMYTPDSGSVTIGVESVTTGFHTHEVQLLNEEWLHRHVACISQTGVIFQMSVADNVALGVVGTGRSPKDVSLQEVQEACVAALLHDFVRELPDGYDTMLGSNGTTLSGGQIQRLEIARALLRNPDVLILDEATSALDITSRSLVFQAIRKRRTHRTTVIITHDLGQIDRNDFVYFMKDGRVAEQGYREVLEQESGDFRRLLNSQPPPSDMISMTPGTSLTTKPSNLAPTVGDVSQMLSRTLLRNPSSSGPRGRPLTISNWMVDVDHPPMPGNTLHSRRSLLPLTYARPRATSLKQLKHASTLDSLREKERAPNSIAEAALLAREGVRAAARRNAHRPAIRKEWAGAHNGSSSPEVIVGSPSEDLRPSFKELCRSVYRDLPSKTLFIFALLVSLGSGAMTPIFSFFLSRIMFEVSIGAPNMNTVNLFGGITLATAAFDGILMGTKFFLMEVVGITWITRVQQLAYKLVLLQEKAWFDASGHGAASLVQILVKDAEDARDMPALLGRGLVVAAMFLVGLLWAMTQGWQLTLAGLAVVPVFVIVLAVQARFGSQQALKYKRAKEAVASTFYETVSNIRAVRSMGLNGVLQDTFDTAAQKAFQAGVRSGSLEGLAFGFTNGLIYLAEALLFYVGAVLLTNGTYTYLQMIQTLNLVIFSVTVGSQLMAFTNGLTKSIESARSLNAMLQLPSDGPETKGRHRPKAMSSVGFHNVDFKYPHRDDEAVFKGLSLQIHDGEHVAIVGASGCGKSTIAALLQRLYQPAQGLVSVGGQDMSVFDVKYLRQQITVVSQGHFTFEGTIRDNIAYGNPTLTDTQVRFAAELAHIHDFIAELPSGYSTKLGDGTQLSGGQAQRIEIARAMSRPSEVLILDECTSALDTATQDAVCRSIRRVRKRRTTIWITHKLSVMQGCDRIIVLDGGRVVEDGKYEDLMHAKGAFMTLASAGEWVQ